MRLFSKMKSVRSTGLSASLRCADFPRGGRTQKPRTTFGGAA